MLIILSGFMIIILIVSAIIGNYSVSAKTEIIENSARTSGAYVEGLFSGAADGDIDAVISASSGSTERMLENIAGYSDDMTVLVTDNAGNIVLVVGNRKDSINADVALPGAFMDSLNGGEEISRDGVLGGIFSSKQYVHAVPVYNGEGEVSGTVLVCVESLMLSKLMEDIIKAIILAILWVMLAALIAAYFITERITRPIKDISNAAAEYAKGRFDVRIPVSTNDEIGRLAGAMNNMAESLDNYDNMRNTFMSNVSHDLRSPMTSISGFVDGILDGVIPPEKHEYYLRIVSTEVKRLSRLVASLLDLSRIQAGDRKFTMAPFDVTEMCREILISFEQKINAKSLEVEFDSADSPLFVVADRDAIYQIVYNLCDNAVKFATEGGVLRITLKRLKNKKALVSVYNDGQGIAPADIPYVFERFYKSDKSRGLNKNGAGLGLFISKTIIEAHGEKIWVESNYEKDCSFSFTLPIE